MIVQETIEIAQNAMAYWEEVEKMGYVIDKSDIQTSKSNRRFKRILDLLLVSKIKLPKDSDFNSQLPAQTFKRTKDFYHEFFNGKYDKEISMYEKKTISSRNLPLFDAGVAFDIDYQKKLKTVFRIKTYSLTSLYSSICLSHENMHGLFYLNPVEEHFNYNYNELLSILIEKIIAYKLDNELGNDILLKTEKIRMKHLKDVAGEYINANNLTMQNQSSVLSLALKFDMYQNYGYLVSGIYAEQLFDYYLDDPNEVSNKIENLIERKETINDVLRNFNINLSDNNTFNTFQKALTKTSKNQ